MAASEARSLNDGWDYRPDWRIHVIESYLVEIAGAKDRADALQGILFREPDPFVRQGVRFRFTGDCVHRAAIECTFRAGQDNGAGAIGSRIKALVIADRYSAEIAHALHIPATVVVAFEKLFWDVRRYLNAELWLETVVENIEQQKPKTPEAARESIWLRTALREGWEGLEKLWFRKRGTDAKALDELSREIEGIAARRALRHMQQLEETGAPVGDDDLKRLAVLSRRSTSTAASGQEHSDVAEFYRTLLDVGTRNLIQMEPEGSKVKALELVFAERLGLPAPKDVPAQRRMRTLSGG